MMSPGAHSVKPVVGGTRSDFGHNPALDGLRGLAILLVVPSNFQWGYPGAGFLGVDVFFVLSGFLITSLLLADHAKHGRIHLVHFYGRRALRLLPALVALLGVLLAYAWIAGSPAVRRETLISSAFALLYVGNWYMAFGGPIAQSTMGPLGPTWSLSVEEQFYLAWPLALMGLLATPIPWRRLALIVGASALIAAVWRAWLSLGGAPWQRLYFGTDTRGDALLIGCALGLLFMSSAAEKIPANVTGAFATVGLMILATMVSVAHQNTITMYRGGYTLAALSASAVLLHLVRVPHGRLARLFSARWLMWIGTVSYGIYLWHVPIAHIIEPTELTQFPRIAVELIRVAATLIAVSASYYVIERPFLRLKTRLAHG